MAKSGFIISIFLLSILLILGNIQDVSALQYTKEAVHDVVASELKIPATYKMIIPVGYDRDMYYKVYSLVNIELLPLTPFLVRANETNHTEIISLLPIERAEQKGTFAYAFYTKVEGTTDVKEDSLVVKVLPLRNIIQLFIQDLAKNDKSMIITISTNENIDLGNATLYVESEICKGSQNLIIPFKGKTNVNIPVDSSKPLLSGIHPIKLTFWLNNEYNYTTIVNATITEFSSITSKQDYKRSFFGFTTIITRTNEGNTVKLAVIDLNKNRFERAFTSYNIAPTKEQDENFFVKQTWEKEISPGESLTVEVTTDYTIPIIILGLLIISAVALIILRRPRIIVRKKAIKMKTTSGIFAVKVILFLKNISQEAKEVTLIDTIPGISHVYEKFGAAKPDKIEGNRLTWRFGTILPGEELVVSYVIYSKTKPFGTVTLPEAVVHYLNQRDKRRYSKSNSILVISND